MGKIVVTAFISLDGVVEAPGGEDFKYPVGVSSSTAETKETSSRWTRRSRARPC